MKLKTKLCSTIVMFCLTIVTLMVGVWAVKSANVNIGGTLSFVAQGIEATISQGTMTNGTWQTASHATTKLKQIEITKTDTTSTLSSKFSSWSGINLNFNENGDDITISFSITNNSDTNSIAVDVSTTYTSATNCTIAIDTSSATIDPNASQNFTLTMKITDKDINASMTNFTVIFNMQLSDSKPADLPYDSDAGYYYVEMGTYNGSAVRWRLVGVKESGASEITKFTGSTAPSAGSVGTFILETLIDFKALNYVFDETNYSNDYAGSDIRKYLKGDYKTFLNLTNDATYNAIAERSVADMYTDIGWNLYQGNSSYAENAVYSITTTNTESDKLWLMSIAEVYTLLGGGTISSDGIISDDWSSVMAGCNWDADNTSDYYWLRSPHPYDSSIALAVHSNGDCYSNDVYSTYAVRPAFNLVLGADTPGQGEEGGNNVDLKYDEDAGYYYVEMGTYNNSAVRWKLVGVDGAKFTGSSAPASGTTGTFILETNLSKSHAFGSTDEDWENGNNDYSTSYIREYLTGNSSYALDWEGNTDNTDNGSFLADFNIAEDDAVYSAITAREITDLHKDIGWATGNIGGGQQYAPPAGTTSNATYDTTPKTTVGADKLWLMSVAEAYTMVGGGTIGADGTIPSDWSTYYDNLIWNEEFYWLRSPYPYNSSNAFLVHSYGLWNSRDVARTVAVRPAFNLEF